MFLDGAAPQTVVAATAFESLTVVAGASVSVPGVLRTLGSLVVDGSLAIAGTLDADGSLTVNGTGTLDLGAGTHTLAGNALMSGALLMQPTGLVVLDGAGGMSLRGGVYANLTIARSGIGDRVFLDSNVTVAGNLRLVQGLFRVAQNVNVTIAVGGDASFEGGALEVWNIGIIDVAGDVTFAGTAVSGSSPTIRCAGDWTSDANFAPTSGTVFLDGTAPQTVLGATTAFRDLTIASGAAVSAAGLLRTAGTLTVDGSLTTTGTLDVDGGITVNTTGTLDLGAGTHTVAGGALMSGALLMQPTGLVVLDGAGGMSLRGGVYANLTIARSGIGDRVFLDSNVTVTGNLRLVQGLFRVAQNTNVTIAVGGDASFEGGALEVWNIGIVDVAGDVTFAGTTVSGSAPTIRCAGDWTSDANFAPTSGTVFLDGTAPQTVLGATTEFRNLTIAAGASVSSAGLLRTAGTLVVDGSLTTSGTLDLDGGVTVNTPGTLDLGAGTHTCDGNATISGTLLMQPMGLVVLDGTGLSGLSGGPFANLTIALAGPTDRVDLSNNATVTGDLRLVQGDFRVSIGSTPRTIAVGGDARFEGGVLSRNNIGTIDVAGDVTFAGTAVASPPTIRCAGNWSSDTNFAPTSSTVFLDGSAPQTMVGAPASFYSLTIAAGAAVSHSGTLSTRAALTVDGSLTTTGTLDLDGGVTVNTTGTLDLGAGTHTCDGNATISGTLLMQPMGLVVLDGTGLSGLSGGPFANLTIALAGPTDRVDLSNNATVTGDLRLVQGDFRVSIGSTPRTIAVGGDARFEGGVLSRNNIGTIDVAGDVTFAGTAVTSPPTIRCAGNWSSDANFAPTSSTIVFDGSGALASTTGSLALQAVQIAAGVRSVAPGALALSCTSLTLAAGATLEVDGATLELTAPSFAVAGTLAVGPNGVLALPAGLNVSVPLAGTLSVVGAIGAPATITGIGAGGYGLSVSGTIAASNAVFEEMNAAGLLIDSGATIAAAPNDLRAVTFRLPDMTPGAVLLDIRRTSATNVYYPTFENPNAAAAWNARTVAGGAPVTFINYQGDFAGPAFENDPNDLLGWIAAPLTDLAVYTATAGVEEVTLDWETDEETGVAAFLLGRSTSATGPFTLVATRPATGPGVYQFVDTELTGGTRYYYRLSEQVAVNGATQEIGLVDATPLAASVRLAFGTAPATPVVAGETWPDFTVRIEDGSGAVNPSATDAVTIVPLGGAVLSGVLTQPAVAGLATFSGLGATAAGTLSFRVESGSLLPIANAQVVVVAAAADRLAFGTAPAATVVAGAPWPQFTVRIEDEYGNLATTYAGSVTATAPGGTGALTGTTVANAVAGLATFAGLSYDVAEPIVLQVASGAFAPLAAGIAVEPASASALVFAVPPAATQIAGEPWPAFTVEIRDQLGNLVTGDTSTVSLSLSTGTGPLLGVTSAAAVGGVATFTGIYSERAENVRVRATSGSLAAATSAVVTVAPAEPAILAFRATPAPLYYVNQPPLPGTSFDVEVRDGFGNVATQATDPVVATAPGLVGNLLGTTSLVPTNGRAVFTDLVFDAAQSVDLAFTSGALPPLPHALVVVPANSDLRLGAGAVWTNPAAPALAQPTQVFVAVANAGQRNAGAVVRVYRGAVETANLIGSASAQIGVGGLSTFEIPWTPTTSGPQSLFAVVENLTLPEATPADNSATLVVPVGALAEELAVSAGQRIAWPNATSTVGITIRNLGASATTLTGASTGSPWLTMVTPLAGVTLQPGQTITAVADLAVPGTAVGAPLGGEPVVESIAIDVTTATNTWPGALVVKLFDQPTGTLTLSVVDAGTNSPLGGALVAFQSMPGVFTTDAGGQITAAVPPGTQTVAVYKQGYLARSASLVVPEGTDVQTIALSPGATLAVESVQAVELSTAELTARGVSLTDPVNNVAFDFVVAMQVGEPIVVPAVELPRLPVLQPVSITVEREVTRTISDPVPTQPDRTYQFSVAGRFDFLPGVSGHMETWIVIPGQVVALKDFFEVSATFVNRAEVVNPTDIQLRQVRALLGDLPAGSLPAGLALPDLDGAPQPLLGTVPDLDAGESATVTWVVRGDHPGIYQLEVSTSAELWAQGQTAPLTTLTNSAVTQPFEVTLPQLRCEFQTPGAVSFGQPFDFGVVVTNEGSDVARAVRVTLRAEDLEGCSIAPSQPQAQLTWDAGNTQILLATIDLGDLEPAAQGSALFRLISATDGVVLQRRIDSGCGGNPSPGVSVAAAPTILTQPISQTVCEDATVTLSVAATGAVPITFQWRRNGAPIAGATDDDLVLSPVALTDAGAYDVVVTNPAGSTPSDAAQLTVQALPVADFTTLATVGVAPLQVPFLDLSTGTVATWQWDFDGNNTVDSTDRNPTHTYTSPGVYTVSLTVGGACDTDTKTVQGFVTVLAPAPVAAFSGTPTSGVAPLAVTFTDASTGMVSSWSWDFGDGSPPSTAQHPQHVYTAPGTYTVTLVATGPGGADTAVRAGYVTVHEVVTAAFVAVTPTTGVAPLAVSFADGSTGASSWSWNFGDGSPLSTAQHPQHVYTTPGTYTVTLVATGPGGADTAVRAGYVTVHEVVTAAFAAVTPTTGVAPLAVSFADGSTGASSWSWNFGDGSPLSTAQHPQHVYTTPGTYTVTLVATGPGGADTVVRGGYVTVHEVVTAAFAAAPTTGTAPVAVAFTDASTGADTWAWDFDGDNSVDSTARHPNHVYTEPGTYTVRLDVSGPGGADSETVVGLVTVHAPPVIRSFVATPIAVTNGTPVTLLGDFDGTGVVDNGVGAIVSGTGLQVVPPFDQQTTYTLTVTNPANALVTAFVVVQSLPPAEIQSFVADPPIVVNGQQTSLTAVFSGAATGLVDPGSIVVQSGVPVVVTPPSNAVTAYFLTVVNPLGHAALSQAIVTTGAVPEITDQPDDQSAGIGGSATFAVAAIGSGPLGYQWYHDGNPIAGAVGATLTIGSVAGTDGGLYTVVVGNQFGSVQSAAATLTVLGGCNLCDGTVVTIDTNVVADFSTTPPTLVAGAAVLPYVSWVQNGTLPQNWTIVIDTGSKRLVVGEGVEITTLTVPQSGQRRPAPGIELRSSCGVTIHKSAVVSVQSRKAEAGPITIRSGGDIVIDGCVLNRSQADGGVSGRITIASRCGDIRIRSHGLVQTDAGSDIQIVSGGDAAGLGGDIEITGRVRADYPDLAPTIRIAAFDGEVRIDGRQLHWLSVGSLQLRTSGVVVRATRSTQHAGRIEIQGGRDVIVLGNTLGHWQFPNPGAVALEMPGNHGGGTIDVRSTGGRILAFDRAFDNANHDNEYAVNRLWAAGDVVLQATGAANFVQPNSGWGPWQMPVADVRTIGNGTSGTNLVRSFAGRVELANADTVLLATPWSGAGAPGLNLLTSSLGVVNHGVVLPADPDGSDDLGVGTEAAPPPLFASPGSLGVWWWW